MTNKILEIAIFCNQWWWYPVIFAGSFSLWSSQDWPKNISAAYVWEIFIILIDHIYHPNCNHQHHHHLSRILQRIYQLHMSDKFSDHNHPWDYPGHIISIIIIHPPSIDDWHWFFKFLTFENGNAAAFFFFSDPHL